MARITAKGPRPEGAVLYLRSSKDRKDVSISAQRTELRKLAEQKGMTIIKEYTDVVLSGKDMDRPGFQDMLRDMRSPARDWSAILMRDTSRLSRRRYAAHVFKHEAKKRGVVILYSQVPEVDPITAVILESVLEAMDEVHSLMSKQKGLAGMAENVRNGFRAGGRPPTGYRLEPVITGTIREGASVVKSRLVPNEDASTVKRYLKRRAAGELRKRVADSLNLPWTPSTLVGIEWNALTYAGHTVWNVHNEFRRGEGYKGGIKRRPRAEWMIKRGTHDALITDAEAEAIIGRLENSKYATRGQGRTLTALSGLMSSPEGRVWEADGAGCYRIRAKDSLPGRRIRMERVEGPVLGRIFRDLKSPSFLKRLVDEHNRYLRRQKADPAGDVRRQVDDLDRKISRALDIAIEMENSGPGLRKAAELEKKRAALEAELAIREAEARELKALARVDRQEIERIMDAMHADLLKTDGGGRREILEGILEKIILDPDTLQCEIHYRIGIERGVELASPGRRAFSPAFVFKASMALN